MPLRPSDGFGGDALTSSGAAALGCGSVDSNDALSACSSLAMGPGVAGVAGADGGAVAGSSGSSASAPVSFAARSSLARFNVSGPPPGVLGSSSSSSTSSRSSSRAMRIESGDPSSTVAGRSSTSTRFVGDGSGEGSGSIGPRLGFATTGSNRAGALDVSWLITRRFTSGSSSQGCGGDREGEGRVGVVSESGNRTVVSSGRGSRDVLAHLSASGALRGPPRPAARASPRRTHRRRGIDRALQFGVYRCRRSRTGARQRPHLPGLTRARAHS